MTTAAVQKKLEVAPKAMAKTPVAKKVPRLIKWSEFEKRYLSREDGYKYEWINGRVEKTEYTMNPTQLYIQRNLTALFRSFLNADKVHGELLAEPDLFFFPEVHRCPDLAWLTNPQIDRLAQEGTIEIPAFVIEVISTRDAAQKIVDKMRHYRTAGVQVVWLIYPIQKEVHVYSSQNLESMTVCMGEKICSAAPALPAFAFPVSDIFKKATEEDK
ncbi:MAG: Uma2 family endonuclease [Saprospiraceae bacterium]|nr:Uma2 family endonuclease [Saprospiraceae bacterium]